MEPEEINGFAVVRSVPLDDLPGMSPNQYMALCWREASLDPWVVWHVGRDHGTWSAENGDYMSRYADAVERLNSRAHERGIQESLSPTVPGDPDDYLEFTVVECRECHERSGWVCIERDRNGRIIKHLGEWHSSDARQPGKQHQRFYQYTLTRNVGRTLGTKVIRPGYPFDKTGQT